MCYTVTIYKSGRSCFFVTMAPSRHNLPALAVDGLAKFCFFVWLALCLSINLSAQARDMLYGHARGPLEYQMRKIQCLKTTARRVDFLPSILATKGSCNYPASPFPYRNSVLGEHQTDCSSPIPSHHVHIFVENS